MIIRWIAGQINGRMERWMDGRMNKWLDILIVGWMNGQTDDE